MQHPAQCSAVASAGSWCKQGPKHKLCSTEGINGVKWEQVFVVGSLWVRWVDGWTNEWRCVMTER